VKTDVYIGTRVDSNIKGIVKIVARNRGMDVSDFLRFLVRRELAELSFLPDETKKAFGLLKEKQKQ
jgi:antitoxin component of RelBE/YafQ-DinJ toxin-antitoxin module